MTAQAPAPASYLQGAPSLPDDLLVALDAGQPLSDKLRQRLRRIVRRVKREIKIRRERWQAVHGSTVRIEVPAGLDPDLFEPWGQPAVDS